MSDNSSKNEKNKNDATFINEGKQNCYLSEKEVDALGEIGNISIGNSATTLSMLLAQDVAITTPIISEYEKIDELFNFKNDFISIQIKYDKGLDNYSVFALGIKDALIIADLMMGGDGKVDGDTIDELQLSAVGEAMNQMIGTAATNLSSVFNFEIGMTPPVIKKQIVDKSLDLSEELLSTTLVAVKFKFKIGDLIDSELLQLMTMSSAQLQVKSLFNAMQESVDKATQKIEEVEEVINEVPPAPTPQPSPPPAPAPAEFNPPPPAQQAPPPPVMVQPVKFASFEEDAVASTESNKNLDLLMDIKLKLTVELGRTELPIGKVLELARGSVIELDKVAGEPVELFANGKLIAKGEVVVIEDNFGLRITAITSIDNRVINFK